MWITIAALLAGMAGLVLTWMRRRAAGPDVIAERPEEAPVATV
jgi:hypothetical protein